MNNNSAHNNKRIIQAWSDAARSDDVEKFLDEFIDANCEWVMMATGEIFRGIDEVRQMSLRSRDARKHTEEAHIGFTNFFSSEDQSQFCVEYDHGAIITEERPTVWHACGRRKQDQRKDLSRVPRYKWQVGQSPQVL